MPARSCLAIPTDGHENVSEGAPGSIASLEPDLGRRIVLMVERGRCPEDARRVPGVVGIEGQREAPIGFLQDIETYWA
jgi:hypothetical protein